MNYMNIDELLDRAENVRRYIDGILAVRLSEHLPHSQIKVLSRVKSRKSIEEKLGRKEAETGVRLTAADLHDLVGFRLVCHFQDDISKSVRLLLKMVKHGEGLRGLAEQALFYTTAAPNQSALRASIENIFREFDLKISEETKDSRYTSIHLVCNVAGMEFPPIEIQVRNVFEEAWSSIEHATKYKAGSIPATVSRHLTVLMSLVQCCVEYAEAIRNDLDDGGMDKPTSIKSLTAYQADIEWFPTPIRELLNWIMQMREKENHEEILKKVVEFLRVDEGSLDEDVVYFLRMEEALSQLKLNNLASAQSLYENIAAKYPRRAMVPHRLSDVFKLKNNYAQALEYANKAESLLQNDPGGSFKTERAWISMYLPLKKAYYLWRLGDPQRAHDDLESAYANFPQDGDEVLRRKFFSSLIYYALDAAVLRQKFDKVRFMKYREQMRAFKMDSIQTALPEEVDTYAWVCHHLELRADAVRAILEVLSCLHARDATRGPVFEHKGKRWGVTISDVATIHEHLREILGSGALQIPGTGE